MPDDKKNLQQMSILTPAVRLKVMKYMFLTYLDEKAWANLGEAEQQRLMAQCAPHVEKLVAAGKFLGGAPLRADRGGKSRRSHRDRIRLSRDLQYVEHRSSASRGIYSARREVIVCCGD
jgi:hypothetical protein